MRQPVRVDRIARRRIVPVAVVLLAVVASARASTNDTGQLRCYDRSGNVRPCTLPPAGDDARYGRDAAAGAGLLIKKGGGSGGFDFTKIANDGRELPADVPLGSRPNDWACTQDNVTGLTWEVKTTNPSDLRFRQHSYTWYNPNPAENGGTEGLRGTIIGQFGTCNQTHPLVLSECNTLAYIAAVNSTRLCGYSDWRLPTPQELRSIISYGDTDGRIAVDPRYLPNTMLDKAYWTSQSYAPDPSYAWVVEIGQFDGGGDGHAHGKTAVAGHSTGDEVTILVRGPGIGGSGPCSAGKTVSNIPIATPTTDFMDHGDGTVTHFSTGLMWKRCAEGLTGSACTSGTAITPTWDAAFDLAESSTFAGYDDWRVPNIKELLSIVETCGYDPAINTSVFPNVPMPPFGSVFWSSTTWASDGSQTWAVKFERGGGVQTGKGMFFLRLVRGGSPSADFDARNPPRFRRRAVRK